MASSFFWKLMMVTLRLRSRNQSAAVFSSVEPAATQIVASARSLTAGDLGLGAHHEGLALVEVDALEVHAERGVAREGDGGVARQQVDLARLQHGQRCCTEVGVNLTLVASPSTAAASDLQ